MRVDIYVGRTQCILCPVTAVLTYMSEAQVQAHSFAYKNKKPLTRPRFVTEYLLRREWIARTTLDRASEGSSYDSRERDK